MNKCTNFKILFYMAAIQYPMKAGTESQEIFSVSGDVAQIRSLLVSGCGLGLAEGLDNDKTVTGCASFTTGTVGANGG